MTGRQPLVMHLAPGFRADDPRLYHLECTTLIRAGYSVELVAHWAAAAGLDPRITMHSLGDYGKPTLAWHLAQRARRNQRTYLLARQTMAALYHYHSLDFIMWGARLRRARGRPVIFDCREDFEGYASQRPGVPRILRPLLVRFVRQQLRFAASYCDAVIVADEGTGTRLAPHARRVLVLHNFPRLDLFPIPKEPREAMDQPYDIVYHGSLPRYHLEACLAIDAALVKRGYHVQWRFLGRIPEMAWLVSELANRGIRRRFSLGGLIPHQEIAKQVMQAKIGIIPLPRLPKFQHNIPQKLFEFMALQIPVVLSDLPPSRPFAGDGACAIAVPADDYEAYADAIVTLLENPSLRRQMGIEGRQRVEQMNNWEKESHKLVDLYHEFLGE